MPGSIEKDKLNVIAMRVTMTLLAVIVGPLVLAIYYKVVFAGLISPDAMDIGQIARNIANGHGFSTSVISPLAMSLNHAGSPTSVPDVTHAPLFPFLSAVLFATIGARDAVLALSSGIWFLASIPIIYLLGIRLFDKRVAVFAVALYLISEQLLGFAISGLPVTLTVFLFSCLLLCLHKMQVDEEAQKVKGLTKLYLLAGAVAGLLYLTDYIYISLVPVAMLAIVYSKGSRKWSAGCLFLAAFILISGPWMVRNYRLTGHAVFAAKSYEVAMYTRAFPAYSLYRDDKPQPLTTAVMDNVPDIVKKVFNGIAEATVSLPRVASTWIAMFFFVAIFYKFKSAEVNLLRKTVYWMIILIVATASVLKMYPEALTLVSPFMIIIAAGFIYSFKDSAESGAWGVRVAPVFLVLMMVFPLINNLAAQRQGRSSQLAPFLSEQISRNFSKDTAIVSDVPWEVAWYSGRPSIWIPKNTSFISDKQNSLKANVILLTSALLSYPNAEKVDEWKAMFVTGKTVVDDFGLMTKPEAPIRVFGRISVFSDNPRKPGS